jgi:hypothetical protein
MVALPLRRRVALRWPIIIAASFVLNPSPALAAADLRQPTDRWVVEFDDAQCVATRNYGSKTDPMILALKSPPIGDVIQLAVIGRRASAAQQSIATVQIGGMAEIRTTALRYSPGSGRPGVHLINLRTAQLDPVRQATSLTVKAANLDERFALSAMAPLLQTMQRCAADLRAFWNIQQQPDGRSVVQRRPEVNVRGLFRSEDYPQVSIDRLDSGTTKLILLIDEKGKVADCTIAETSGVAALDAQSCAVLKERLRAKPALGLDGRPIKSAHVQTISWRTEIGRNQASRLDP